MIFRYKTYLIGLLGAMGLFINPVAKSADCFLKNAPQTVYTATPVATYLLMVLAPEKLAGWNFPAPPQAKGIFPDSSFSKPVIGGWFGQGRTPNMENLVATKPQLIVNSGTTVNLEKQASLKQFGIPVCSLKLDRLEDYPTAIRQFGVWLGKPQRANTLADYTQKQIKWLSAQKHKLRTNNVPMKTVYYAETPSGLATECRGSIHSEVIPLSGAINSHLCPASSGKQNRFGRVNINFEQLLAYNPDAIITQDVTFYRQVYVDAKWQALKAVKNKQVFLVPQAPFRWIDRPPSFMRMIAAPWLMHKLYPDQVQWNDIRQTKEFFHLFFQVSLTDKQVQTILNGKTL
jgi:iron complex transport system substrate-binding protein